MNFTIKEKSGLKHDQKTAILLLAICIIAFILAFKMEYRDALSKTHNGFLTNVFLGLSASAGISWVCIFFPMRTKIIEQIQNAKKNCAIILYSYASIINSISLQTKFDHNEDPSYFFVHEKAIKELAVQLQNKILTYSNEYSQCDIESKELRKLYEIYIGKTYTNLAVIIAFVDYLGILTQADKEIDSDIIIVFRNRYNRLQKSAFESLLFVIEENCSMDYLITQYLSATHQKNINTYDYMSFCTEVVGTYLGKPFEYISDYNKLSLIGKMQGLLYKLWGDDSKNL